ncbi:hypothetical protein [Kribbella sp. NPDC048915]|uniref:hypothetical protein n=1 Tax=Kribbella sp. NPDC048915 TaxID=3155148 RepID=UPI0033E735AD
MGRSRRRRSAHFKSWGLVLAAAAGLAASVQQWSATAIVLGILLLYVAVLREVRCRVETTKHRPCGKLARGTFGTCELHVGYKRGLPKLVRGQGFVGLPTFMWPRDWYDGVVAVRAEPEPAPGRASTSKAARPAGDRWSLLLGVGGLLVALVGVVRDFVAG